MRFLKLIFGLILLYATLETAWNMIVVDKADPIVISAVICVSLILCFVSMKLIFPLEDRKSAIERRGRRKW